MRLLERDAASLLQYREQRPLTVREASWTWLP